jgi:hypothetical protein
MPSKRLMLLLAALAALLTAPPAFANTYTVHSCKTPEGTWVGADGWVFSRALPVPGRDSGTIETCESSGAPLRMQFGIAGQPAASGQWLRATLSAPLNTTIVGISALRTFISAGRTTQAWQTDRTPTRRGMGPARTRESSS